MTKPSYKTNLKEITTFIFDIDGVITDGVLMMHPSGEFLRNMSVKDGYAIKQAIHKKYNVFIISGGNSKSMKKRLQFLGVKEVHLGVSNKEKVYRKLKKKYNLTNKEIVYMGDDIPDMGVMTKVGISCCPQDAAMEIREISNYVSHYPGGRGAVRDIIRQVLKVNNHWGVSPDIPAS